MKKIILLALLVNSSSILFGQEKLNKLLAPSSPAANILDLQPKTILSPKTYQALETSLFSNFFSSGGKPTVPNDFSLEFTPYWTKNHGLSLEKYLFPETIGEQLKRSSSFSLASTQHFLLGDSSVTNALSYGYRTTLFSKNKNDMATIQKHKANMAMVGKIQAKIVSEAEKIVEDIEVINKNDFFNKIKGFAEKALQQYQGDIKSEDLKKFLDDLFIASNDLPLFNKENPDAFLNAFYNLLDSKLKGGDYYTQFKSYIRAREGFTIDFAYAGMINFPTNNFEFSIVPRQSFWITPTVRLSNKLNFLQLLGVARLEWYNLQYYKKYFPTNTVFRTNIDFGMAVSAEFDKFSFQLETVGRNSNTEIPAGTDPNGNQLFIKKTRSDFQCIGTFNYHLNDQITLTYHLGNKFDPIQNPNNKLVSLLTMNFGFGSPTKSDIGIK